MAASGPGATNVLCGDVRSHDRNNDRVERVTHGYIVPDGIQFMLSSAVSRARRSDLDAIHLGAVAHIETVLAVPIQYVRAAGCPRLRLTEPPGGDP